MNACPYVEETFKILGKKWTAMIIHYIYECDDHQTNFSDIKNHLENITPRALSLRLNELVEEDIVFHHDDRYKPYYQLTKRGIELAKAFNPIREWGMENLTIS